MGEDLSSVKIEKAISIVKKSLIEGGVACPSSGEIDLMKYFNNDLYFLDYDFERIAAEDKDVVGLLWLTKIKLSK
ncbi:hypothetical protein [Bergeyella sp. RCAD1439]|uniref:hypothetical protein n=1 Tax=Bergeyella anatis TaxID=3113737 RepID=UPI002E18F459|nr:hypothetical protein [Bergeyella sp. RCAD1439]